MPTVDDLARLQGLIEQLTAIGKMQRGELILAENWNTLVDSVASIARTVLGQEATDHVAAHKHEDQVTVDWLVPLLRDQLERGPLADPAMQSRLFAIEQQLRSLALQIDGHRKDVEGFQGRLTDVVTRDIVREAAVTDVSRQVTALGDSRSEVLDLRRSIGSVQTDLSTVVEAARRLEVNGQPVDLGTLTGRLGDLEAFREGFVGANGQVLTGAVIERRLAENRNLFVTQDQLDDVLSNTSTTIPTGVLAGIEDRISTALRAQVNASLDTLAGQIRTETDNRLNGVGSLIDSRLSSALPGVIQTVTTNLAPSIDKARQDAVAAAGNQTKDAIAASEKALRAELAASSQSLQASLASTVKAQLGQLLPAELSGIRADLTALGAKVDLLGTRTGTVEATLKTQGDAVALLQQDAGRLRLEMRDLLKSELKLAIDAQARDIDTRFSAIQKELNARIDLVSRDVRQQALDAAVAAAVDSTKTEARNIRTQILAEMRQVAKEEAGLLVREQLAATGTTRVNPVNPNVPSGRINR